jgi:hypothetical protein
MTRHGFIWSLFAMLLAPLGLRLMKAVSLSPHGIDGVATVTAIDHSAGSITIDTTQVPTNEHMS